MRRWQNGGTDDGPGWPARAVRDRQQRRGAGGSRRRGFRTASAWVPLHAGNGNARAGGRRGWLPARVRREAIAALSEAACVRPAQSPGQGFLQLLRNSVFVACCVLDVALKDAPQPSRASDSSAGRGLCLPLCGARWRCRGGEAISFPRLHKATLGIQRDLSQSSRAGRAESRAAVG